MQNLMKNAFVGTPREVNYAKAKLGVSFSKRFVKKLMNISPTMVGHYIKAFLMNFKIPLHFPSGMECFLVGNQVLCN